MKLAHWIAVAGALASSLPAHAATTDPAILVYRVSGAVNDNNGSETFLSCSNFSAVAEDIEIVVRDSLGNIMINSTRTIGSFGTFASGTLGLGNGFSGTGYLAIGSTTTSISCTAFASFPTIELPLHMQRYNPMPNTLE
jgi:hypothetical protein